MAARLGSRQRSWRRLAAINVYLHRQRGRLSAAGVAIASQKHGCNINAMAPWRCEKYGGAAARRDDLAAKRAGRWHVCR